MKLEQYIGRIVRLNQSCFKDVVRRARNRELALENFFLVAGVTRGVRKLICYGADLRITVGVSDVVLV
jgi:hypothetical protein